MRLAEHELPLRSVQRPPLAHAPLQGASNTGIELRMPTPEFLQQRHRANARRRLQYRHDLLVEDSRERVRAPPPTLLRLHRRNRGGGLNALGRGRAEPRLGGRGLQTVALSKVHVKPHLVIGYVSARHRVPFLGGRNTLASPLALTSGLSSRRRAPGSVGLRPPSPGARHRLLTLIDGTFSS